VDLKDNSMSWLEDPRQRKRWFTLLDKIDWDSSQNSPANPSLGKKASVYQEKLLPTSILMLGGKHPMTGKMDRDAWLAIDKIWIYRHRTEKDLKRSTDVRVEAKKAIYLPGFYGTDINRKSTIFQGNWGSTPQIQQTLQTSLPGHFTDVYFNEEILEALANHKNVKELLEKSFWEFVKNYVSKHHLVGDILNARRA
jgi:hypothetical protein